VKTSFLDLLTQLKKQGKKTHFWWVEQRVKLIKSLLHKSLKRFDFSILFTQDDEHCGGSTEEFWKNKWRLIFDQMWTDLAAKCPNLQQIKERRPVHQGCEQIRLDLRVFTFTKLLYLDTDCYADSSTSPKTNIQCLFYIFTQYF